MNCLWAWINFYIILTKLKFACYSEQDSPDEDLYELELRRDALASVSVYAEIPSSISSKFSAVFAPESKSESRRNLTIVFVCYQYDFDLSVMSGYQQRKNSFIFIFVIPESCLLIKWN